MGTAPCGEVYLYCLPICTSDTSIIEQLEEFFIPSRSEEVLAPEPKNDVIGETSGDSLSLDCL